jgi:cell fate regulator YaaT (PSP1 superfamily)
MTQMNMVGVQFRRAGKIYDFDAGALSLRIGDQVVVDTDRGPTLAEVAKLRFADAGANAAQIKRIIRVAADRELNPTSHYTDEEAVRLCGERVKSLKLDMRILKAESQLGGNKMTVYFSAEGRVDFRDLVKDLAGALRARVELKQVGSRDETKLLGGLGICGREFCCSSFLREFVPVSIKMAKNQNLALNPSKISGGCGRLLCCLTYEDEVYTTLRKTLPARGTRVQTQDGRYGDVIKTDLLNQMLMVEMEDGIQQSLKLSSVQIVEKKAGAADDDWGDDIDLADLMEGEDGNKQGGNRPPAEGQSQPNQSRPQNQGQSQGQQPRRDQSNDRPRGQGDQRSQDQRGGGRPSHQKGKDKQRSGPDQRPPNKDKR